MSDVIRSASFPIEVIERVPTLTALREAIVTRLLNDAGLAALAGDRIYLRPARINLAVLPVVTLSDFGARTTPRIPLLDRIYQIDVWARDVDEAERLAVRVQAVLHEQPLPLPSGQARIDYLSLIADRDDVAEEGDVSRKTLEFRLLAFELT